LLVSQVLAVVPNKEEEQGFRLFGMTIIVNYCPICLKINHKILVLWLHKKSKTYQKREIEVEPKF